MEKREKDIQGTARLHQLSRCWEAPLAARDDLLEPVPGSQAALSQAGAHWHGKKTKFTPG